jgi:hypothetical protein
LFVQLINVGSAYRPGRISAERAQQFLRLLGRRLV